MASKTEVMDLVVSRLNERAGGIRDCVVCGERNWLIEPMFAQVQATRNLNVAKIGGNSFPLLPLVCQNCGNTHFLNLMVLGFRDLSELAIDEDEDEGGDADGGGGDD